MTPTGPPIVQAHSPPAADGNGLDLSLRCPSCRRSLRSESCPCGFRLIQETGVWRALTEAAQERYNDFFSDYLKIRHAEGRGSDDPGYYLALPFKDRTEKLAWQWSMRAKTYRCFERKILDPLLHRAQRPPRVLDLGAGVGWLSYHLALKGCRPVAVDLLDDPLDGLGAARHYAAALPHPFPCYQAEFDNLPFDDAQFDLAIFNASFHYSVDYAATLREVRRVLAWGGRVVVLDSPIYRRFSHGERMVEERRRLFDQRFGTRSESIPSMEYLDRNMLDRLARELNLTWSILKPWYGWRWFSRPLVAAVRGKRPPSRFWILTGTWNAA